METLGDVNAMDRDSRSPSPAGDTVLKASALSTARACDRCRARKVKCDRATPCAHCRAIGAACRITMPNANDRKQRVLISSRYEKNIEDINERLSGIEDILRNISTNTPDEVLPSVVHALKENIKSSREVLAETSHSASRDSSSDPAFEGNSSLLSQSVHARGVIEKIMGDYPQAKQSTEMKEALLNLRNVLQAQRAPSTYSSLQFPKRDNGIDPETAEMPPTQAVLALLRSMKKNLPSFFYEFPMIQPDIFEIYCQKVYFATEEYTLAQVTLVNGCLCYVFKEFGNTAEDPKAAREYKHYASLARANFEKNLQRFGILVEPSLENCQAIMMGAAYSLETSRPYIATRLVTICVEICKTLGWHRLSNPPNPPSKTYMAQKFLFWCVYSIDCALSLRLGRSASFPNEDISTGPLDPPEDPRRIPWYMTMNIWLSFGQLQGDIYQNLYTAKAFGLPVDERVRRAEKLTLDIEEWRGKAKAWTTLYADSQTKTMASDPNALTPISGQGFTDANVDQVDSLIANFAAVDVGYYTVLTLVQRVIPPSASTFNSYASQNPLFNSTCVNHARSALEMHQNATKSFADSPIAHELWQGYLNWTLLLSPFTPFIVVFYHTTTTRSTEDLTRLRDFMISIQPSGPTLDASEAHIRLHELCVAFYRVAECYLRECGAREGSGSRFSGISHGAQSVLAPGENYSLEWNLPPSDRGSEGRSVETPLSYTSAANQASNSGSSTDNQNWNMPAGMGPLLFPEEAQRVEDPMMGMSATGGGMMMDGWFGNQLILDFFQGDLGGGMNDGGFT